MKGILVKQNLKGWAYLSMNLLLVFVLSSCSITDSFRRVEVEDSLSDSSIVQPKKTKKKPRNKLKKKKQKALNWQDYFDLGEKLYGEGKMNSALKVYKKVLFLKPGHETSKARIKEIKRWFSMIVSREKKLKNLFKKKENDNRIAGQKIEEKRKELELALAQEQHEKNRVEVKERAGKLLIKASFALVQRDFQAARDLTKRSIMVDPESAKSLSFFETINQAEEKWHQEEALKKKLQAEIKRQTNQFFKLSKASKEKEKENQKKLRVAKEKVLERKSESPLEKIVNESFPFSDLPPAIAAVSKVEFLNERSLILYKKTISDYESDLAKGISLDFPNEDTVKKYNEGVANAYYKVAQYYFDQSDHNKSVELLGKLIDLFPNSKIVSDALYLRGRVQLEKENHIEAYHDFEKVVDSATRNELIKSGFREMAKIRKIQGKYGMALQIYSDIRDDFKEDDPYFDDEVELLIGDVYLAQGELTKALESFEKVEEKKQGIYYEKAQALKASVLVELGQYDLARSLIYLVLKGDSLHSERNWIRYLLGESFYKEGRPSDAVIYFEKAKKEYPKFIKRGQYLLHLAQSYRDIALSEEGLKILEELVIDFGSLEKVPSFIPYVHLERAKVFQSLKREEEAIKELKYLSSDFSKTGASKKGKFLLADIYYESQKWNRARKQYQVAYLNNPTSKEAVRANFRIALCLKNEGKKNLFEKYTENLLVLNRALMRKRGRIPSSQRDAFFEYHDKLLLEFGQYLVQAKRIKDSIPYLKEVVDTSLNIEMASKASFFLARSYEMIDERREAIKYYQKVLVDLPQGYWAERAQFNLENLKWNEQYKEKAIELGSSFTESFAK